MRKLAFALFILLTSWQIAQTQTTITGTITSSEDKLGLPGASVIVKGTTIGTTADIDGNYKLVIPSESKTLSFSFVGLKSQEIAFTGQTVINIELGPDVFKMEEVVVAGVASATPKRKLSVSVTKVGADELENVPASSAATALQGKVSGVTIVSGGTPGQDAGIRLRSSTSLLGSQSPLIIVDGVILDGSFADINANDIESYEVVKGAAASALYGSKAGSGVIVVKTKRGNSAGIGKTEVVFRNEYGTSEMTKKIDLSTHHVYLLADDYKTETRYTKYKDITYPAGYAGGKLPGISGNRIENYSNYADQPYAFINDPQDAIFLKGSNYTNYFSISNNGEKTKVLLSAENYYNSGIVFNKKGTNRQNFRANIDMNVADNIKLSSSTLYTQTALDLANGGDQTDNSGGSGSAFNDVLLMNPDVNLDMDAPISDTTQLSKYYIYPDNWSISGNPKHALYYEERKTSRSSILQNFTSNINLFKWLVFDAEYSFEKRNSKFSQYIPVGFMGYNQNLREGAGTRQINDGLSQTLQTTLNFNQKFGEFVSKGKVAYMFEKSEEEQIWALGNDYLASGLKTLSALAKPSQIGSYTFVEKARNYFGIVDMDYKDRYILSFLYRMDGSSLFGPESRWNPYYRYSMAYRINEDIKIPGIQELKLNFAVGTSGLRPGMEYQYETFSLIKGQFQPATSGNKNLKPSETKETEIGFNIQFLEKFEATLTYAFNSTTNQFARVPQGAATGFPFQYQNAADMEGASFEWSLGAQWIKTDAWEWRSHIMFDHVSQKITKLKSPSFFSGPYNLFKYQEGETFGVIYGDSWVTSLDQMKGQLPAGKTTNDYVINSDGYAIARGTEGTPDEKPIRVTDAYGNFVVGKIADMNPDFNLSMTNNLSFKNISFSMLWSLKKGGDIYNLTKQILYLEKRHGDFDQAAKPEYKKKAIGYYSEFYDFKRANTYFVEDGSFLKLRELSLYYALPNRILKSKFQDKIKSLRIGILARNLLTITNYSGWDPEVASGSDLTNFALDDFNYPNYRSYNISLELKF